MHKKTLITEAALAILATSGFQVAQSLYSGGFEGVNTIAAGTFVAGLVALIQRYRHKRGLKMITISHVDKEGLKTSKTVEVSAEAYFKWMEDVISKKAESENV